MKTSQISKKIIFFDGACGTCNRFVLCLLDIDKGGEMKFCSLQSSFADHFLKSQGIVDQNNTLYYFSEEGMLDRSTAVLKILETLIPRLRVLFLVIRLIPLWLRDGVYRWVASNRHRFFNNQSCRVMPSEWKYRFIEDVSHYTKKSCK